MYTILKKYKIVKYICVRSNTSIHKLIVNKEKRNNIKLKIPNQM